ncbi:MAG TPA: hypothetical protein VF070_15865 [Streptosporangiaceae bacterium]
MAPIRIQYGGPRVAGVMGSISQCIQISMTTTSPIDHSAVVTGASRAACEGKAEAKTAATSDRD